MPISKKPSKPTGESFGQPDEKTIQAVIHKGGSVPADNHHQDDITPKNLQLRLYPDQIDAIDGIIQQKQGQRRRPRQSRHSWLIEAIEEKIERERQPQ
jgi:hypothetical protein